MNRFSLAGIIGFVIFLQGCGLRTIVIPNLDWLITRQVSQTLSLKGEQKDALKQDIVVLLEQSKPQAQRIKEKLQSFDIESVDVFERYSEIRKEYTVFVEKFAPIYAKYVDALNPKQIEDFIKQNEKDNNEILKEKNDAESNAIDSYERFFGKLTQQQKKLVSMNSEVFIRLKHQRLERRKDYQKKLYSVLTSPRRTGRKEKIIQITLKYNANQTNNPVRQKSLFLLKEILNLATSKQKNYFQENLKDKYIPWIESYLEEDFK